MQVAHIETPPPYLNLIVARQNCGVIQWLPAQEPLFPPAMPELLVRWIEWNSCIVDTLGSWYGALYREVSSLVL